MSKFSRHSVPAEFTVSLRAKVWVVQLWFEAAGLARSFAISLRLCQAVLCEAQHEFGTSLYRKTHTLLKHFTIDCLFLCPSKTKTRTLTATVTERAQSLKSANSGAGVLVAPARDLSLSTARCLTYFPPNGARSFVDLTDSQIKHTHRFKEYHRRHKVISSININQW